MERYMNYGQDQFFLLLHSLEWRFYHQDLYEVISINYFANLDAYGFVH
ncbi:MULTISPECIES: hypothetical protein [Paenibacillus]|nr:hypothetical protein [Paenibacillus odorifer]